jgi:hypothetical protein
MASRCFGVMSVPSVTDVPPLSPFPEVSVTLPPILPEIAYAVYEPPLPPAPAVDPVRLLAPLAPPAPAMSDKFPEIALDCSPLICKH